MVGVVCSPSHVSFTDKSNLVATLRGQVNAIMVVSEPFATAYGIGEFHGTIVVDIGAGTTDIARLYGTFPSDDDQISIAEAGDWLDLHLMDLIRKKYTGAQVTKDMVRRWKEASSYVGGDVREVPSTSLSKGSSSAWTLATSSVKPRCLVPSSATASRRPWPSRPGVPGNLPPEHHPLGRRLAHEGIAERLAAEIADIGNVAVRCVEDPIDKVAVGPSPRPRHA